MAENRITQRVISAECVYIYIYFKRDARRKERKTPDETKTK